MSASRGVAFQPPNHSPELQPAAAAWSQAFAGPTSSTRPQAVQSLAQAVHSWLRHGRATAEHLDRAIELDPALIPARVLRAFGMLGLGRRDLRPQVQTELELAQQAMDAGDSHPRERFLVHALRAAFHDDSPSAVSQLDGLLDAAPADPLAFKLDHALRFLRGDSAGMRRSIERCLPALDDEHPARGYALGCHAFTLVETGEPQSGERVGRAAVERDAGDAWGAHAVAHALLDLDQPVEGIRWLRAQDGLLPDCNNFAGHLAWHEALFQFRLGETDKILELYDRRIAIYPPGDYRDLSNTSTLLARLEGLGVDVGARWHPLVEIARSRFADHGSPFADLHHVLSLCAGGQLDLARRFVESMRTCSQAREDSPDQRVMMEVGVPVARALVNLHSGRVAAGCAALAALSAQLPRLGGSSAQRSILRLLVERAQGQTSKGRTWPQA